MVSANWSIQDATDGFHRLVDAALAGEPQLVTWNGQPAVVVVAAEAFARLTKRDRVAPPFVRGAVVGNAA